MIGSQTLAFLLLCLLALTCNAGADDAAELAEAMKAGQDAEPAPPATQPAASAVWWTEARFGMFLCWAPAAALEDGWGGWSVVKGKTWRQMDQAAEQFNPTDYDPNAVARLAKRMGARYVVFTAKHHEGLAMWDTAVDDSKVTNTPYAQDVLRLQTDALRKHGLRVGVYVSKIDWHRPEFRGKPKDAPDLKKEIWGIPESKGNADWPKFMEFYFAQCEELLSRYGQVDVLWLDGWRKHDPIWQPERLLKLCAKHQPAILLNDRFGDPRKAAFVTPESHVPRKSYGRPWESCITSNGSWYYRPGKYRNTEDLVRLLIDCVSKDGNLLLNFALNPKGTFDDDARQRMEGIGRWMDANSDAIYGCGQAPLRDSPWGRTTAKPGRLYLHLYRQTCRAGQRLLMEGLQTSIESARILGTGRSVEVAQTDDDAELLLPDDLELDPAATVIEVRLAGPARLRRDFVRTWSALAPMPGHTRGGQHACRHDFGLQAKLDTDQPITWNGERFAWKQVQADPNGYVNLLPLSSEPDDRVTYVAVDVIAKQAATTRLLWGSNDRCELYLNGKLLTKTNGDTPPRPDADRVSIDLPQGRSTIVVKVYNYHGGPFGFYAWIARARQLGLGFEPTTAASFDVPVKEEKTP